MCYDDPILRSVKYAALGTSRVHRCVVSGLGSMEPTATGHFKITISEPQSSDALGMRLPPAWGELQPGQWQKMTGPR